MTVSPPLAHIPDWGPSLTFVSKPGGYKYVTDQYAALLASTWNKKEEETRRDREDRQNNVNWDRKENYKNHKQYSDYDEEDMPEYTYHRMGHKRDPKARTEFLSSRTKPYRGQYSVIGKRTGVGRRTGIGGKGVRHFSSVNVHKRNHREGLGKSSPARDPGGLNIDPWYNPPPSYSVDPWQQEQQAVVYQPYQQLVTGYALDPYAILALLGFLVFLFYIIYSFLNNTGNGGRSVNSDIFIDQLTEHFYSVLSELKMYQKLE